MELPFCTTGVDEARVQHVLAKIDSLLRSPTISTRRVEVVLCNLTFTSQVIGDLEFLSRLACV